MVAHLRAGGGGCYEKLGDFPANLLINQGVMATLQERRLGYHSRAGLEPGTSRFSTLRIKHYAARGMNNYKAEGREGREGAEREKELKGGGRQKRREGGREGGKEK